MNEIKEDLENILDQLQEAILDAEKFDQGNSSAGTRVRTAMQNIKGLAQNVRLEVQAAKNSVSV